MQSELDLGQMLTPPEAAAESTAEAATVVDVGDNLHLDGTTRSRRTPHQQQRDEKLLQVGSLCVRFLPRYHQRRATKRSCHNFTESSSLDDTAISGSCSRDGLLPFAAAAAGANGDAITRRRNSAEISSISNIFERISPAASGVKYNTCSDPAASIRGLKRSTDVDGRLKFSETGNGRFPAAVDFATDAQTSSAEICGDGGARRSLPRRLLAAVRERLVDRCRPDSCGDCWRSFLAFIASTVGLTCLLVAYTVLGGFIFVRLEAPNERLVQNDMHRAFTTRLTHPNSPWFLGLN